MGYCLPEVMEEGSPADEFHVEFLTRSLGNFKRFFSYFLAVFNIVFRHPGFSQKCYI